MGTNMRHVHFKPGLMADREHVAYFGPLMKLEEVTTLFETVSSKRYKLAYGPIEDSDQPAHPCSLIRVFDGCSVDSHGSNVSSGGKLRL